MSKYGYGPADAALSLRDMATAGATVSGTPIALDFDALAEFKAVVNVADVDDSTDTEWALSIQVDTSESFGSPVTVWSESDAGVIGAGTREVPLSGRSVLALKAGATHVRVRAVQTGAGGEIEFGAHLVDVKK